MTSIRVAVSDAELEQVHRIRREVFVQEQNVPEELEYDEYDATSVHVLALGEDGTSLGTGRLIHGAEALKLTGIEGRVLLGRLAVVGTARSTGLGARLVRALEQAGRDHGGTELELHAQVQALGFYERLGYTAEGPVYEDAGIPHRTMTRQL